MISFLEEIMPRSIHRRIPGMILAASLFTAFSCGREIQTKIEIQAPRAQVWKVFADFDSHKDWNPFIRSFRGTPEKGGRIRVLLKTPGKEAMEFQPTVLGFKEGRLLEWEGRLFLPGLFTGRHRFEFRELPGGRTLFLHGESFSGILVPFIKTAAFRQAFLEMNQALKKRVEKERN